jgi:hypothetical protein
VDTFEILALTPSFKERIVMQRFIDPRVEYVDKNRKIVGE